MKCSTWNMSKPEDGLTTWLRGWGLSDGQKEAPGLSFNNLFHVEHFLSAMLDLSTIFALLIPTLAPRAA